MVDVRIAGMLLLGGVVYAGCCLAVVRAFFLPRPDGVALPSAIWWLVGALALSACVVFSGSASAGFACAIAITALLPTGQALGSLWWRGRAMQTEIEALRKVSACVSAASEGPSNDQAESQVRDLELVYAKAARAYDLTRREEDVLRLLAEGCSVNEVAERLVVSPNTVKSHLRHIYRKMGVNGKNGIKARIEEAYRS